MMDIAKTIEPKSDQQNYDDYVTGPKIVTVSEVRVVESDQPIELHLAEFPGRPYKPGLSMRRVLLGVWGQGAAAWVGRRLRLYGDPEIRFGKQAVGGIRISHMSHITEPKSVLLTVKRGRKEPFVVQPLEAPAPDGWEADVAACDSAEELKEFYEMATAAGWWNPTVAAACTARKKELADAAPAS